MKVACATTPMSGLFSPFFTNMRIVNTIERLDPELDLLILTGGSDVHPSRYGEPVAGASGFDLERDEKEFSIARAALRMNIKILAVCRGLQLINVVLGGTLVQHMNPGHGSYHVLKRTVKSVVPVFEYTNSMHHQCIKVLGQSRVPTVLSIEPVTNTIEEVCWGNNIFAVQWHPEFSTHPVSKEFFGFIHQWVLDKIPLVEE